MKISLQSSVPFRFASALLLSLCGEPRGGPPRHRTHMFAKFSPRASGFTNIKYPPRGTTRDYADTHDGALPFHFNPPAAPTLPRSAAQHPGVTPACNCPPSPHTRAPSRPTVRGQSPAVSPGRRSPNALRLHGQPLQVVHEDLQADVVGEEEVARRGVPLLGVVRHARVELGEQEACL